MTQQELINLLRVAVKDSGSQKVFAAKHNISEQYVSHVLSGKTEPGAKILTALGVEKIISYEIKEGEA